MGEVIHGNYSRWVNEGTLHSVTNYMLHKALYSGHNDHNYFEIAHTVKYLNSMAGDHPEALKLYNFVDNHDVERIYTKLTNKAHFTPVHILLYTLPGVPSIYYGSEFGIEGKKERFSDDSLRPALSLSDYADAVEQNSFNRLIAALGNVRQSTKALSYGDYKELVLTNRQFAFSRNYNGESVVVTVNNDDSDYVMTVPAGNAAEYIGALSGERVSVNGGNIVVNVKANAGEIWLPVTEERKAQAEKSEPVTLDVKDAAAKTVTEEAQEIAEQPKKAETAAKAEQPEKVETAEEEKPAEETAPGSVKEKDDLASKDTSAQDAGSDSGKEAFEQGKIAGLQEAILAIMEKNGPVTEQMRRDVEANVYHDSLIAWVKSFR